MTRLTPCTTLHNLFQSTFNSPGAYLQDVMMVPSRTSIQSPPKLWRGGRLHFALNFSNAHTVLIVGFPPTTFRGNCTSASSTRSLEFTLAEGLGLGFSGACWCASSGSKLHSLAGCWTVYNGCRFRGSATPAPHQRRKLQPNGLMFIRATVGIVRRHSACRSKRFSSHNW